MHTKLPYLRALLPALASVLLFHSYAFAQGDTPPRPDVQVINDDSGSRLQVDGRDFMMFGMNWGYMPIGENYTYDFWGQTDEFIQQALAPEMALLQEMGINTIRQYVGIPPRWVQYIYETYGIYTVVNHTVGRYGMTHNGVWHPNTDYSNPDMRETLKDEIRALVEEFQGTPGMLMWLLGNENNYGLTWSSFEIEALPEGERNTARARYLYSLFGEVIDEIKQRDPHRPVAIANGDLQYIDLIVEECPNLDVLGSNVYRGISARDFFQEIKDKLGVPAMFTEFGADAFNAVTHSEDQLTQARYLLGQWQEIYEQSAGKGRVGNAVGGMIFQWSDGWWKFRQDERLEIHDTNASWPNAAYPEDYREGDNNMNEEWWGICAKGYSDARGFYDVYPRAAYYALAEAFQLDPFAPGTDIERIQEHFAGIHPMGDVLKAQGNTALLKSSLTDKVWVSNLRMKFETYSTGGENISTPPIEEPQDEFPSYLGFGAMQSFFVDFSAKPTDAVQGRLSLSVLGNVAVNPIDEIFYENRGVPQAVINDEGQVIEIQSLQRVAVYQAELSWEDRWFEMDVFYRTGHLHWQYEGDFFGLYRDAYYGENIDIYNGVAPNGLQLAGKKSLRGLTVAFGPQLWWGANPAVFVKYQRQTGGINWSTVFQEDFAQRTQTTTAIAIPVLQTRKLSLQMETRLGPFDFEGGALWSGQPQVGRSFQFMIDESLNDRGDQAQPSDVGVDQVVDRDTFGFRGKLTLQSGRLNWYGQAGYMGLVAEAGPTAIPTFTGWRFRDSGSGNQMVGLTGLAVSMGNWQIGPNVLWQKPVVGPMLADEDLVGTAGSSRNITKDPFVVIGNRETTGAEIMLSYDATPATWMWAWDNDIRENAGFAASLGFAYWRHYTTADANLFVSEEQLLGAFMGNTPSRDLWEVNGRFVNRVGRSGRMITHLWFGLAEPWGDSLRLVNRFGMRSRVAWPVFALKGHVMVNDYGPYDYHRNFNLTFPLQLMADVSINLGRPRWFGRPQTRFGVRGTYRTLDRFSNRYQPADVPPPPVGELYPAGLPEANEWEVRTYVHFSL